MIAGAAQDTEITSAMRARSPIALVVHVGAHLAEEAWLYEALGAQSILWIEADPLLYRRLAKRVKARAGRVPAHATHLALISESDGVHLALRRFSNDGASNSVYGLSDDYASSASTLRETGETVELVSQRLSTALLQFGIDPEEYSSAMLVLDVQGHEMQVLRGASVKLVSTFRLVCVEVSMESVYEGGAKGGEVISWMTSCGFVPVTPIPEVHGDILFARVNDGVAY
jgi:FkbM family methyltransferase